MLSSVTVRVEFCTNNANWLIIPMLKHAYLQFTTHCSSRPPQTECTDRRK